MADKSQLTNKSRKLLVHTSNFTHNWRVYVFHITFCPFGYGKQKGRETNDTQFRSRRRSQERRFINSNVRPKCEKQWLAYFD